MTMKPSDIKGFKSIDEKISKMEKEVARLKKAKNEIAIAMLLITDSLDRQIFMATINGQDGIEIANAVGKSQSAISRRLLAICDSYSWSPFDVDGESVKIRGYSRRRKQRGAVEGEF